MNLPVKKWKRKEYSPPADVFWQICILHLPRVSCHHLILWCTIYTDKISRRKVSQLSAGNRASSKQGHVITKKNLCKPGSCLIFSFLHQRFQKSSSNILKCIKWNTTCKNLTALQVKWNYWQKKRVKKSSLFSSSYFIVLTVYHVILMNIFLYSHHMSAWYCIDIERRFSVLIIQGSKNLRVYIRGKRPKKVNLIQVYCVIV